MKNSAAISTWGRGFNTLAQNETARKTRIIPISGLVVGKGADITNQKQMHRWAEEKLINDSLILALVDAAKNKGEWERCQSYWNTFHCMRAVVTAEGKLHGLYCKNKACAICNGIRKAQLINQYMPVLKTWEDPFSLVLTLKSPCEENLKKVIDEMFALIQRIIAKYRKRAQRGKGFALVGIRSFECTYNPIDDTYHPHFHFILPNKKISVALHSEWISEGRKLWGKSAISEIGQCNKRTPNGNMEEGLREAIKYGTKIFTEDDPQKKSRKKRGEYKIYIEAFDNIISAMKGRRIFDRFGFNLPPRKVERSKPRVLKNFKQWNYLPQISDWHEIEGCLSLTGYVAPDSLKTFLEESIQQPTYNNALYLRE